MSTVTTLLEAAAKSDVADIEARVRVLEYQIGPGVAKMLASAKSDVATAEAAAAPVISKFEALVARLESAAKSDAAKIETDISTDWGKLKVWFAANWVHIAGYSSIILALKKII